MKTRRAFIKSVAKIVMSLVFVSGSGFLTVKSLWAKARKVVLSKGTKLKDLVNRNPAGLDARNLEITSLENFGTMGLSDHQVDITKWRLEIDGEVKKKSFITYEELRSLPSIKKRVLMICPGFFANYGEWEGISIKELLKISQAKKGISHITFRGPSGQYEKTERFSINEAIDNKVFLAWKLNGVDLPVKHGYPLRVVAEEDYGYKWLKYVYSVEMNKI